jgi:hypothetical protein
MKAQSIKYLLRVWLTGGLLGPLIFAALDYLILKKELGILDRFMLFWGLSSLVGLFYSFPSFVLLWIVLALLKKTDSDVLQRKLISILLCFIFIIITFQFFPQGGIPVDRFGLLLLVSYFFTMSVALIFYRLEKE